LNAVNCDAIGAIANLFAVVGVGTSLIDLAVQIEQE
jgi:hypothetical protein